MNPSRRFLRLLLPLALAALLTWLCATAATKKATTHDATGVVREKLSEKSVLIAHDEIPGFMAAMTMAFDLVDPREGAALQPGDRIRFRLQQSDNDWLADRIVVLGKAAPPTPTLTKIARLRPGDEVPVFALLDERSQPLTQETLRGRFTLVTFIFTRCPVPEFCPAMAMKFGAIQAQVEKEPRTPAGEPALRLLSVTLDPAFDRPDILTAYGEAIGAKPAIWNFATGTSEEIAILARRFAVFTERKGVTLDHTLCTALIGPDGRVREIWRGHGWKTDEVFAFLRHQPEYAR